jgi:hypothetical protein
MNMTDNYDALDEKIMALFEEHMGYRPDRLSSGSFPEDVKELISETLSEDFDKEIVDHIAFHMVDWSGDLGFLAALFLWPKRFTKEEISIGFYTFLQHAPDHLAAAAKLFGTPVTDVFNLGALDGEEE